MARKLKVGTILFEQQSSMNNYEIELAQKRETIVFNPQVMFKIEIVKVNGNMSRAYGKRIGVDPDGNEYDMHPEYLLEFNRNFDKVITKRPSPIEAIVAKYQVFTLPTDETNARWEHKKLMRQLQKIDISACSNETISKIIELCRKSQSEKA